MFCSNCGGKIEEGVKFCSSCGKAVSSITNEPVIPTCSNCGKKLEDGVKFCSGCGTAVGVVPNTPFTVVPLTAPVAQVANTHDAVQMQSATADEKYCFSCGYVIKKAAEVCPKCGVNQNSRSSTTAIDIYCTSCGKLIKKVAPACPFCGVVQDSEKPSFIFALAGFVIPIVGWILAIVWRKSSPRKAKSCLIWGTIGFVFWLIIGSIAGAMM